MELDIKKLFYQQAIEIWQEFCELHRSLYDITCDEYLSLLSGEIDSLEVKLVEKENIIEQISRCENKRKELIHHLNIKIQNENKISKASNLLDFMKDIDEKMDLPILQKLNLLLIDMIEKIQQQNKKNQVFLNKAMFSLKEIKEGFKGEKQFVTYGANGFTSRTASR